MKIEKYVSFGVSKRIVHHCLIFVIVDFIQDVPLFCAMANQNILVEV